MKPQAIYFKTTLGGKELTFETGRLARQAGGAVTLRQGDSIILAAATMGGVREGTDFFPLTVDYEERMYAGGRIPGSFFRREGKPSTEATLIARLTDRPLRPLFPEGMRNEVQVVLMSLSADTENPLDMLAINAASAALMISDIPFGGPVGAVRIGYVDGKLIVNPSIPEMEISALDLRVAGTREAILMVECGAQEVGEDLMVEALQLAHREIQSVVDLQERMAREVGKPKREVELKVLSPELIAQARASIEARLRAILDQPYSKENMYGGIAQLREAYLEEAAAGVELSPEQAAAFGAAFDEAEKEIVRDRILYEGKRPDNRGIAEIREITCEVDISPRAHGSGLFTRGETQVLTLATLGTPKEAQELDNLLETESKRYMHHYNFPPYSTGEVKRLGGQSRREIGHGALAERALVPVIPDEKSFPYTLRLVSEVLSSNGSSSMASVCGSTLALMDTGVPIKAPVSGVAMGLIKSGDRYVILTDILGAEDHLGDMDFKVAGTREGITALQMDIKIAGITPEIMAEALERAREARFSILDIMLETIAAPNPSLKPHAPRIETVKVPVDKIGAIIGPGGKNIRALQEETHTKIDIDDDGTVYIASTDGVGFEQAKERILGMVEVPEIGRIYTGKCVRVTDFGAFIEILPGVDGMVHISQLASERVNKVEDIVQVGDELSVMVTDISPDGKIRLSRQALLEGWTAEEAREHDNANRKKGSSGGSGSGGSRGGSRGGDRGDRGGQFNRRR
ncbi:MAG: polyribonucleotide nucleotidyltransferase [Chloroflexi bacterium]|jgi:polyribonucleotide nucleotidyltransferase|nr:polyribonucleotide nucleotidyltransferase [Anaerolineaceae bacterium]NLI44839.1 polyribonucleotide nucleotidyltransferase [Chloroflexota bacterium]HOE35719.1 polyribonucleotide nucleotidyltransferase [Anaerolineaceae bacterium]HOT26275.1 polyribonucleotide nucleotidyltransferase [Anaerolineaceae bacterium]HQH58200.1 polyribonucleotide nucleotidyltransferase [Anaerolineaceae bacterium]